MGRRPGYISYRSFDELLKARGSIGPLDLDRIFEQLYRIRHNRDEYIHTLRAV